MGTLEDRELAIQIARAETKYLMDICWIFDTTILGSNPPEEVRKAYDGWRKRIEDLATAIEQHDNAPRKTRQAENYRAALTLRAIAFTWGFT